MAKGEPPYADLHPMRVLFLIPKNPPPQLEGPGNFSKGFKEFVSLCLNKDPEERPTAKDLLKHRFIKGAKKTGCLVELIERRQRWLQVVGNKSSSESEEEKDREGAHTLDAWDFDTIKPKNVPTVPEELPSGEEPKDSRVSALIQDPRGRSMSEGQNPISKSPTGNNTNNNQRIVSPGTTPTNNTLSTSTENGKGKESAGARPSALTSVIYPVLSKLLKQNQEEGVIAALAQLKIAFDNAERAKPGITHSLIAQIIETLKR